MFCLSCVSILPQPPCLLAFISSSLPSCSPSLSLLPHDLSSLKGKIDLLERTWSKMRRYNMRSQWKMIIDSVHVCPCVILLCGNPCSVFCGQTEGSGKVDHIQLIISLCLQQLMDHWKRKIFVSVHIM